MDKFLSDIVKNKRPCIFVSPHLDDAVLSAGGLMCFLAGKTKVIVINVFTEASDERQTLSARAFMKGKGYNKPSDLFAERQAEDKRALQTLNLSPINLGFPDVLWRKKTGFVPQTLGAILPELQHVYPTYRFHIAKGKIAKKDASTIQEVTQKLQDIINKQKNPLVFCPLGVGNHVDHCIVRNVCTENFSDIVYWSDFPYNSRESFYGSAPQGYTKFEYQTPMKNKKKLIETYQTQVAGLFPNSVIPDHNEVFFVKETP